MSLISWQIFPAIICSLLLAYMLHSLDVNRIEAKDKDALAAQVKFDIQQCDKNTQPAIVSDSNEVKTLTDNLNACLGKLQSASTCMPLIKSACNVKTAKGQSSGLTSNAITAHNIFCDQQVDSLNNAKDFATECLKNGTCQ